MLLHPSRCSRCYLGNLAVSYLLRVRARLTGLDGVSPLTLDTMKPSDAIELFMLIVGADRAAAEPGPVAAVVLRCGYLPLAIRLVASWLRHHPAKSVKYILNRLTGTLSPISTALQLSYGFALRRGAALVRGVRRRERPRER